MGDYDLRISCYCNDALLHIFSGSASFNGDAIFSGQVKDEKIGIAGKLGGIVAFGNNQIILNILKTDDETPLMEFQVCKLRDNREYGGSYRGAWRYKYGIRYEDSLWARRSTPKEIWTSESLLREKPALIELNPVQDISPEQNLNTSISI